jgi:hypothetical protein
VEINMEDQTLNAEMNGLSARFFKAAIRQPIFVVVAVAMVAGLGLYLNWPAVVALGLAPLILTLAPCVLMCAVGVCGMTANKSRSDSKPPTEDDQP